MKKSKVVVAGHLAALLTILIWGTTFISTKALLISFTPIEILFFRFIIGYIALFVVHPKSVKVKNFKEEVLFIVAGFCGVTMYFLLENIALTYTLASNVGIIVCVAPFFTALVAHFYLKEESLRPQFFTGFVVAIVGIVLIFLNGSYVLKISPRGDFLAILACVFWAFYSVIMRQISTLGYHNIACTRRVFFYGLILMLPFLRFFEFQFGFERFLLPINLLNIVFLGLGASAICFVTWNWCVGILGAVKTSAYIYLVPVVTIAASYVILQENIQLTTLVGTLFTLVGLFISERTQNIKRISFKRSNIKS